MDRQWLIKFTDGSTVLEDGETIQDVIVEAEFKYGLRVRSVTYHPWEIQQNEQARMAESASRSEGF